jgi:hypothetical protein
MQPSRNVMTLGSGSMSKQSKHAACPFPGLPFDHHNGDSTFHQNAEMLITSLKALLAMIQIANTPP